MGRKAASHPVLPAHSSKHLSPGSETEEAMAYECYTLADMSDCHAWTIAVWLVEQM